jgi:hypothetical protein
MTNDINLGKDWEIVGNDGGNFVIKDKQNGNTYTLKPDGEIGASSVNADSVTTEEINSAQYAESGTVESKATGANSGEKIVLPLTTVYEVSSTLSPPAHTSIRGYIPELDQADTNNRALKLSDGADTDLISATGRGITVENLLLDGNSGNQSAGDVVALSGQDATVKWVGINSVYNHGVVLSGPAPTAKHIQTQGIDGQAVRVTGADAQIAYLSLTTNGSGGDALYLSGDHSTITGGLFFTCGGSGVRIEAKRCSIRGARSNTNDSNGFRVNDATGRNTVANCVAYNNGQDTGLSSVQRTGFRIAAPDSGIIGCVAVDDQATTTQRYGVELLGDNAYIIGGYFAGNDLKDIRVDRTDCTIIGATFGSLEDNGTRTIVNGKATNDGDPSSTGEWNGNAARAYKFDATVWDTSTSPSTPYKADENGNWVAI